jgi:hypothetical protein
MPSSTPKQARYMAMLAHDPAKAKAEGVPLKVAKDFNQADKGKKLAEAMKRMPKREA